VPVRAQSPPILDCFLARLGESHEICAYEATERLARAGEAVGLDVTALIRLLDEGMTFEELLEHIETKMERLPRAS